MGKGDMRGQTIFAGDIVGIVKAKLGLNRACLY